MRLNAISSKPLGGEISFCFFFFKFFNLPMELLTCFFLLLAACEAGRRPCFFCFRRCAEQTAGPLTLICEVLFFRVQDPVPEKK